MLHHVHSGVRLCLLAAAFLLAGCVITTEKAYFDVSDFVQPSALAGDWLSVPSETDDDILKVRIVPHGEGFRAQPLRASGAVDPEEQPVDFTLVPLGDQEYILVLTEGPNDPVSYLGLRLDSADRLAFYLFNGGETDGGKAQFNSLVSSLGLSRDASYGYEARLTGGITKAKLKALFKALLAAPAQFDAHPSVYDRTRPY